MAERPPEEERPTRHTEHTQGARRFAERRGGLWQFGWKALGQVEQPTNSSSSVAPSSQTRQIVSFDGEAREEATRGSNHNTN